MRDPAFEWTCPRCHAKPGAPCTPVRKLPSTNKHAQRLARAFAAFEEHHAERGEVPAQADRDRLESFPGLCQSCGTPAVLCIGEGCCKDCNHRPKES